MLITFEGIDGSGKSTQIALLKEYFNQQNKIVSIFREPGGTDLSEKIRTILLDVKHIINPISELLLFSAARSQLVAEKVLPALERGEIVILDRFFDSTTAYQGYGRKSIEIMHINEINHIASLGREPDITFYLKLSLDESLRRTATQEKDRMENSGNDFFKEVIKGYDTLAENKKRIVTIPANKSPKEVHENILKEIDKLL